MREVEVMGKRLVLAMRVRNTLAAQNGDRTPAPEFPVGLTARLLDDYLSSPQFSKLSPLTKDRHSLASDRLMDSIGHLPIDGLTRENTSGLSGRDLVTARAAFEYGLVALGMDKCARALGILDSH